MRVLGRFVLRRYYSITSYSYSVRSAVANSWLWQDMILARTWASIFTYVSPPTLPSWGTVVVLHIIN